MGLTGERGVQTEGKTTTQHHCWVSVDCGVLKHGSPKDRTENKRKEAAPEAQTYGYGSLRHATPY